MSKWQCVKCETQLESEQPPHHCGVACKSLEPAPQKGGTEAQGKTQQEGQQPQ